MKKSIAAFCLVLAGCGGGGSSPVPPAPSQLPTVGINMMDFAVQSICNDGTFPALSCGDGSSPGPLSLDSTMIQRRGDWATGDVPNVFMDAVQTDNGAELLWAFSGHTTVNPPSGDGGEVYATNGGNWVVTQTQDGGTPAMQYFVGGTGWVIAPLQITTCDQGWSQLVATLNISLGSPTPPNSLANAFTRACLYPNMSFPAIVNGQHVTLNADTVVAEHYDGGDIGSSHALERTWFTKGFGRLAWAAWVVGGPTVDPSRYPSGALPLNDQTMPGSAMSDVRLVTNIKSVSPWKPRQFGWP